MGLWDMIVAVVLIACVTAVLTEHQKTRRRGLEAGAGDGSKDRIDKLEERVRVLERLVTDERDQLSRRIDALKD